MKKVSALTHQADEQKAHLQTATSKVSKALSAATWLTRWKMPSRSTFTFKRLERKVVLNFLLSACTWMLMWKTRSMPRVVMIRLIISHAWTRMELARYVLRAILRRLACSRTLCITRNLVLKPQLRRLTLRRLVVSWAKQSRVWWRGRPRSCL